MIWDPVSPVSEQFWVSPGSKTRTTVCCRSLKNRLFERLYRNSENPGRSAGSTQTDPDGSKLIRIKTSDSGPTKDPPLCLLRHQSCPSSSAKTSHQSSRTGTLRGSVFDGGFSGRGASLLQTRVLRFQDESPSVTTAGFNPSESSGLTGDDSGPSADQRTGAETGGEKNSRDTSKTEIKESRESRGREDRETRR
ncbi:Hypothetical predicted protein [Xyrichtys novacula]|uniref:Uncharacterized protein n=1 Tax=Xyrichtys novacula TaxID=13765 RepID=A0AAV1H671_XYRNO|nr:Hypothetical predicted protein [Xyrichtys novacula]